MSMLTTFNQVPEKTLKMAGRLVGSMGLISMALGGLILWAYSSDTGRYAHVYGNTVWGVSFLVVGLILWISSFAMHTRFVRLVVGPMFITLCYLRGASIALQTTAQPELEHAYYVGAALWGSVAWATAHLWTRVIFPVSAAEDIWRRSQNGRQSGGQ